MKALCARRNGWRHRAMITGLEGATYQLGTSSQERFAL
jgi:hypothetical protein